MQSAAAVQVSWPKARQTRPSKPMAGYIRVIGQLDLEVDDHTEPRVFHYALDLARTHPLPPLRRHLP